MLFSFDDFDRTFAWFDEMQRRMDAQVAPPRGGAGWRRGRWLKIRQTQDEVILRADLPGVAAQDIDIALHEDVLTLTVKRAVEAPEGFSKVHLSERQGYELSRSFALPARVDPEQVTAKLVDGVLRVRLAKAKSAQPRQIAVQ